MEDRGFSELELRSMLEHAKGYHVNVVGDRFVIDGVLCGRRWEIIVEPDDDARLLVIVTAYPIEE